MSDENFNRAKPGNESKPDAEFKSARKPDEAEQAEQAPARKKRRMTFREATQRTKLDVRLSEADLKRHAYRWVNGDAGRIQELEERGYELVDDPHLPDERGTERRVGRAENGSKLNARLMRIPREFLEEDEAEKRSMRKEQIDSVIRNRGVASDAKREGISAETMSVT